MVNATITIDMEEEYVLSSLNFASSAMPSFRWTHIQMRVRGQGVPTATDCSRLLRLWTLKTNASANTGLGDIKDQAADAANVER